MSLDLSVQRYASAGVGVAISERSRTPQHRRSPVHKRHKRGRLCLEQRPPASTQARAGPWALTVPRGHLVGVGRGRWSTRRGPASGLLLLTAAALAKRLTPGKNHWAEFPGTGGYRGGEGWGPCQTEMGDDHHLRFRLSHRHKLAREERGRCSLQVCQ